VTSAADFTVVSSTPRFSGRVFSIRTDRLRMPDGTESDRDIVVHPGAVAVVALDEQDRVVMVRQFRQPVAQLLDELPAGLLDVHGEPALVGAQRELFEEAAVRADTWHVLIDLYTSPGMTDEAIRIYLARGLTEVPVGDRYAGHDEEATMTLHRVPLDDAVADVLAGRITNAAAAAGILASATARAGGWVALRPADAAWSARPSLAGPPPSSPPSPSP
jgi:8-oxo-dGDP phosphatase